MPTDKNVQNLIINTLTKAQYESIANPSDTELYLVPDNLVSRNIGEIVTSTIPFNDAGLHLLDGTLLQYGSYKEFIDYIAELYNSGNYTAIFDTEANWQTSVTTYGICGKFVYDSTNNTVRLPKITGILEGTVDLSTLGNLVEAGLPNIEAYCNLFGGITSLYPTTGAIRLSRTLNRNYSTASGSGNGWVDVNFDASLANPIYGNSNTVQPQSIKVLYYIVVATSAKTDIQVDIDNIVTDLNGKADVDLFNTTNFLSDNFLNKLAPDWYNGVTFTYSTADNPTEYVMPATGLLCYTISAYSLANYPAYIYINGVRVIFLISSGGSSASESTGSLIVRKGDYVTVRSHYIDDGLTVLRFFPLKGSG